MLLGCQVRKPFSSKVNVNFQCCFTGEMQILLVVFNIQISLQKPFLGRGLHFSIEGFSFFSEWWRNFIFRCVDNPMGVASVLIMGFQKKSIEWEGCIPHGPFTKVFCQYVLMTPFITFYSVSSFFLKYHPVFLAKLMSNLEKLFKIF